MSERTVESSPKRQKRSDGKQEENTEASFDRLSAFPDHVICCILSFLPTKTSVSTSILAKRWRFMWAHVPSLNFIGEISPDVIHRVMVLHKVKSINTFGLSDMSHCNEYQLETWITTAVERNVKTLNVSRVTVKLPPCIFACKTLVFLDLNASVGIPSSGSPIYLPSLKRLHLHNVTYQAEEALPRLLSGCPVLEDLYIIKGTMDPNLGCYNISSPSIKKLRIIFQFDFKNPVVRVVINAPALRYLKVFTCNYEQLSLSPMTSLIEADMFLNGNFPQANYYCNLSVKKLFHCFPNVKCLKLKGRCKRNEFPGFGSTVVKFDNLTKLDLGVDWRFVSKFLESADNLEELTIQEVHDNRRNWIEPREARFLYSLRNVTIHHFGCTEQELSMVKYILKNAKVLKRMEIHSGRNHVDSHEIIDTLKRILLFHRGSTECEVAFV